MIEAFPLHWPPGFERTKYPESSQFGTSFAVARDNVLHEIRLLGGKNTIISTNIPLKRDGLPYANQKRLDDPGVAVYFEFKGEQVVFACDKWSWIEDNMQAIRKSIEAMRGLDRWGVSDMLKRAFTGFKALPENGSVTQRDCWSILGIPSNSSVEEMKTAYRNLCKVHHPDVGGDKDYFTIITEAYNQASR